MTSRIYINRGQPHPNGTKRKEKLKGKRGNDGKRQTDEGFGTKFVVKKAE